jgi:hypothetical protein
MQRNHSLQMAHEDPDKVCGRLDTVKIALTHLISEETYFTFMGASPAPS